MRLPASPPRAVLSAVALAAVGLLAPYTSAGEKVAVRAAALADAGTDLDRQVNAAYSSLEALYKHLHANPELSLEETQTAARLAREVEALGFTVTRNFGGTGVVAVLRNGAGPTVLVRTDMDALPVEEQTGLPYASKATTRDRNGNPINVMHACGHDVHMTCWVGAARTLAALRDRWHGTLVFIAQPGEELGAGAEAMLAAGLYTKFPRPDYCLALHCDAQQPAGHVAFTPGLAMANIDMVSIVVRGKGGHGAWPHMTVDPVVLAARIVLDLQTLVSRENNPTDPLVLTVGTIHGGVKANVIPNEVKLQLTVRSTREVTRKRVLAGIERMAKAAAVGAGAPEPVVNISPNWYTPAVLNDGPLTDATVAAMRLCVGEECVHQRPPMMGGEDFALYGRAGVPSFLFFLGTQNPELLAAAETDPDKSVPSLHSDRFAPVAEPTLKGGTRAMSVAVLNLLARDGDGSGTVIAGGGGRPRPAPLKDPRGASSSPARTSQVR